jgi:hypothetical protein
MESSLFHQLLYFQVLLLYKHLLMLVLDFKLCLIKPSFFILAKVLQQLKVILFVFFLVFIRQKLESFLQINWLFKYQLPSRQLLKHINHLHRLVKELNLVFMILYLVSIFCNLILLPVFFNNALVAL